MKTKALTLFTALSFLALSSLAETYSWIDENGKKHFGDKVPPEYKDSAKQVDLPPLNTLAPETEVRLQNKAMAERLRREDGQKKGLAKQREQAAKRQALKNHAQSKPKITKEQCRDQILTVKQRTACLRAAHENEQ